MRENGGGVSESPEVGRNDLEGFMMSKIEKGMGLTTVGHLWSQQKSSVIVFVQ